MDKSKIEQIKQENALAKMQGMKMLKIFLLVLGIVLAVLGVLLFFRVRGLGFIFIVLGIAGIVLGIFVDNNKTKVDLIASSASTQYSGDIAECQTTYAKIEALVKNENMKSEFGYLATEMKKDVDKVADLANKLTNINNIIDNNESLSDLEAKLAKANANEPKDETAIKALQEKIEFVKTMNGNRQNLESQLQKIKQNLVMVYTKLTVLDTTDTGKMSETSSELQKLLDRKITAQKFEQDL